MPTGADDTAPNIADPFRSKSNGERISLIGDSIFLVHSAKKETRENYYKFMSNGPLVMTPFFSCPSSKNSFHSRWLFHIVDRFHSCLARGPAILLPHNSISRHLRNFITRRKKVSRPGLFLFNKDPGETISLRDSFIGRTTAAEFIMGFFKMQGPEEDQDWKNKDDELRISRLRQRRGRSIVHRSLEDNYGAVVVANHEALAQFLDQVFFSVSLSTYLQLQTLFESLYHKIRDFYSRTTWFQDKSIALI